MISSSSNPPSAPPPHTANVLGLSLCMGVLIACGLLIKSSNLFADPDTLWHIAVGQQLVATHHFPVVDTLSHTFAGQPWIAKEWLSQVLLYAAFQLGEWRGVALLTAIAGGLTAGLLTARFAKFTGPTTAALIAFFSLGMMLNTVLARPHILALPVFAAWVIALITRAEKSAPPPWAFLPLLILWANMHAGFAFGVVLAFGCAALAVWGASSEARWPLIRAWGAFCLACVAATFITPYGVEIALFPFRMMGGNEAMALINEWQPLQLIDWPTLTPNLLGMLSVLFALMILAALARAPLANAPHIGMVLFVTYEMMKHARFSMLFAIVAPVIAAPQISDALAFLREKHGLFKGEGPLSAVRSWKLPSAVIAAISAIAITVVSLNPPQPAPQHYSPAALHSVGSLAQTGRVFNSYNFGGFLIQQGVKTFIDGRADQLFLGGFISQLETAYNASSPDMLSAILDKHQVTWALVVTDNKEAKQLAQMPNWRQSYKDKFAEVYIREK